MHIRVIRGYTTFVKMAELIYKQEVYDIVGACMDVHKQLGHGFLEAVYGDALMIEFEQRKISYNCEVKFDIDYKGQTLAHKYGADIIVFDKIVLEIKAAAFIVDEHVAQCLNYVKASGLRLGVIVNFGREKMEYKRLIY